MQIGHLTMHRLSYIAAWCGQVGDPEEKSANNVLLLLLFDVWVCSLSQVTALHICSIYSIQYVRVGEVFNVTCAWTVSLVLVQRIMPYLT
jgi:hypothetical protein